MCPQKGGHCYLRVKMGMFLEGSWKNSKTPVERVEGGMERVEGSVESECGGDTCTCSIRMWFVTTIPVGPADPVGYSCTPGSHW